MSEIKIGTKIKIKSMNDLIQITVIKGKFRVILKSGLHFPLHFLGMADSEFEIDGITEAGTKGTNLNKPSYSLKGANGNVWVTDELFDIVS
ncbi:MAG: hypothetical protein PF518_19945 [Spirochaetaceae bacterium]|jgi:hypothetical protein|nr:hypothetical protein [Spirochaetaceae bacterium]